MLRKLTESDRESLMDYLEVEPGFNLFLIGDVENYGFDTDFQELWGSFSSDGDLEGVLLRYHSSFIPYTRMEGFDHEPFKEIIRKSKEKDLIISGKASIVETYDDVLENEDVKQQFFCEITSKDHLDITDKDAVHKATEEDVNGVVDLLSTITEFSTPSNPERMKGTIRDGVARIFYVRDGDKIISVSQTTAETSTSAMVVGVATAKDYRKMGHMCNCLSVLCDELLEEKKSLCLFYDNPKAGSVYHRLGFETIGRWMMRVQK